MKIKIDNKEFELNVAEAISAGVLIEDKRIKSFTPGDLFCPSNPHNGWLIVTKPIYSSEGPSYGFVGLGHTLTTYSNYQTLYTAEEVLDRLNSGGGYTLKGNVNSVISEYITSKKNALTPNR